MAWWDLVEFWLLFQAQNVFCTISFSLFDIYLFLDDGKIVKCAKHKSAFTRKNLHSFPALASSLHFCTFIALLHLIVNNRNNSSKKGTFLYTNMKYPISRFNLQLRNQLSIQFDLATIPDLIMYVSEAKHVSLFSTCTNWGWPIFQRRIWNKTSRKAEQP